MNLQIRYQIDAFSLNLTHTHAIPLAMDFIRLHKFCFHCNLFLLFRTRIVLVTGFKANTAPGYSFYDSRKSFEINEMLYIYLMNGWNVFFISYQRLFCMFIFSANLSNYSLIRKLSFQRFNIVQGKLLTVSLVGNRTLGIFQL